MGAYYKEVTNSPREVLLELCAAGLLYDRTRGEVEHEDTPHPVGAHRAAASRMHDEGTFLEDRGSGWHYYVVVED